MVLSRWLVLVKAVEKIIIHRVGLFGLNNANHLSLPALTMGWEWGLGVE